VDGGPDEEGSAIARCEEPYEFGHVDLTFPKG
jgi:hypothetical protein